MHEQHQVHHLVEHILADAKAKNIHKIKKLQVVMGDALGFDEGSVKLYFETFGEGNALAGTEIVFRKTPAMLYCADCKLDYAKNRSSLNCPKCGKQGVPNTTAGKEFFAENIESI